MHHEKEKKEIYAAILSLSSNVHQRRYPDELRERVIAYTETALAQGGTYAQVERDLGISNDTLRRFRRNRQAVHLSQRLDEEKTTHNFLPVKTRGQETPPTRPLDTPSFRVQGPCGIAIDFADMKTLTDFIRQLSC